MMSGSGVAQDVKWLARPEGEERHEERDMGKRRVGESVSMFVRRGYECVPHFAQRGSISDFERWRAREREIKGSVYEPLSNSIILAASSIRH